MSSIKSRSQSPKLLQRTEGLELEQHLILSNILLNSIYFNFSKALYKASGALNENETTVFTRFLFTREENEQMEKTEALLEGGSAIIPSEKNKITLLLYYYCCIYMKTIQGQVFFRQIEQK